ncbi:MAG: hypothetical protein WD468_00495 [Pirellulales bacterium]
MHGATTYLSGELLGFAKSESVGAGCGPPIVILAITGGLTLAAASNQELGLGGQIQRTSYDFIQEAGNAALVLQVVLSQTLTVGFPPAAADSLIILSSN